MVCLGNICRSPLAEGILQHKIKERGLDWEVDSAGTSSWHIGEQPHKGSIKIARQHQIDITNQKARQFRSEDFKNYDLILAMDIENYRNILDLSDNKHDHKKVKMILNYSNPGINMAVPDPYFTGNFQEVYDLLDEACEEVINHHSSN